MTNMAKKYHIPDLANATLTGLVDMLADAKERAKEAKFYEGFYRDALVARWPTKDGVADPDVMGEKFCAERSESKPERFSVITLRAAANAGDAEAQSVLKRFTVEKDEPEIRINVKEIGNKKAPAVK